MDFAVQIFIREGIRISVPEGAGLQSRPNKALAQMAGAHEQLLLIRATFHWTQMATPLYRCLPQSWAMATPGGVWPQARWLSVGRPWRSWQQEAGNKSFLEGWSGWHTSVSVRANNCGLHTDSIVLILSPILWSNHYKWGKMHTKKTRNMPKVIQLVSSRVRI